MRLARVTGQVVSTVKHAAFDHFAILVVQDLDDGHLADGEVALATGRGSVYSAADPIGAGVGELVLVAHGSAAVYAMRAKRPSDSSAGDVPADATIVGIVDAVTRDGRPVFRKA